MRNLNSPLFFYCLFILGLIQHLTAIKTLDYIDQFMINCTYHINNVSTTANNSGLWYDMRIGNTDTKRVMMKTAKPDGDENLIKNEIKVYKDLYSRSRVVNLLPYGIVNALSIGSDGEKKSIVLDLLGDDFMKFINESNSNGPEYYGAVCHGAKQMIGALNFLHQQGYVHRDVRPENIAAGAEDFDPNRNDVSFKGSIYLCNLERAREYKSFTGLPKRQTQRAHHKIEITPYTPRHSLLWFDQYQRDDIESLGYTMLRIAGSKELPWSNSTKNETIKAKDELINGGQTVEKVCKAMGISDLGMINVFKNFFQLYRFKYFDHDGYKREIYYDDFMDCFEYPAQAVRYFERLKQTMTDTIYEMSKKSTSVTTSEEYKVVRLDKSQLHNINVSAMVKSAIRDDNLVKTEIKVLKDLYSKSRELNLLPYHIPNMLGYGADGGKPNIILDLLEADLMESAGNYGFNNPQYYGGVCFWAQQMITALKFLHQHGYVHRDIQPKNFAVGSEDFNLNRTDVSFKGATYLFNLGVAQRYKHDNGTVEVPTQQFGLPFATSPYSSRQALWGYTQYPRDDMEAFGYTMLTVTAGALPWSYHSINDIGQKDSVLRNSRTLEILCKTMGMVDIGMINVFKNYFRLLHTYFVDENYSREINYEELKNCFVYPAH